MDERRELLDIIEELRRQIAERDAVIIELKAQNQELKARGVLDVTLNASTNESGISPVHSKYTKSIHDTRF